MKFEFPESLSLAHLPTPIEALPALSSCFEGPDLYIKRDDYTGLALSGNKVRKLEFLLAEAKGQNCDYLITCGGAQSNHARAMAVAATRLGMKSHLVLRNGDRLSIEGNLFINRLVGAEIQYISPEEYMRVDSVMRGVANDLKAAGHRPYVIPEGGSNELGSIGYVKAAMEIAQQLKQLKLDIRHIIVPIGSGGTYAGLLAGKYIYDLAATIHGINVCDNKNYFENTVTRLLQRMDQRFNLPCDVAEVEMHIIDGYVGKGYALSDQQEIDIIKQVARTEGILLDPVYTGKAMFGLREEIRKGRFNKREKILFLHTGGIFGLFPKKNLFF